MIGASPLNIPIEYPLNESVALTKFHLPAYIILTEKDNGLAAQNFLLLLLM